MEDLSCQELVELVTGYLEGALSHRDRDRFEAHVTACPGCEAHLEQVRSTIALARAGADVDQRPEIAPLLDAFRDRHRHLR